MFDSILFCSKKSLELQKANSSSLKDINLNQIFDEIIENNKKYNLEEFFCTPLQNNDDIIYRQQILSDLENKENLDLFYNFSINIFDIGEKTELIKNEVQEKKSLSKFSQGNLLFLCESYIENIKILLKNKTDNIKSTGLKNFIKYLEDYSTSESFSKLNTEIKVLRESFSKLEYTLYIKNGVIKAKKYDNEENITEKVKAIFSPLIENNTKNYIHNISNNPYSIKMENMILNLLPKLYEDEFKELDNFAEYNIDFINTTISNFAREIQFYISWTNFINDFRKQNIPFCYPKASQNNKNIYANDFFDLALCKKIGPNIITNNFYLKDPEKIIVITGPNQGGKTTFARAFGQLFYLFSLGLSVPGTEACINIPSKLLTHFEKEEKFTNHKGKLQDELERLNILLKSADKDSIIIINEIFSSTTKKDSGNLGRLMIDDILSIGAYAVIVTFIENLGNYNEKTVNMVSNLIENSNQRSFKILRSNENCKANALYIAEKYNLTYEQIKRRLSK